GRLLVLRIAAEGENVRLRDPEVLDKLPGRIWQPGGLDSPELRRDAARRRLESGVRVLPGQQLDDVLPERLVVHGLRSGHGTARPLPTRRLSSPMKIRLPLQACRPHAEA